MDYLRTEYGPKYNEQHAQPRCGFGEFNAANFHFSETAIDMVESMRIKAFVLDYRVPLDQCSAAIVQAYDYCRMTSRPIVVFLNLKD